MTFDNDTAAKVMQCMAGIQRLTAELTAAVAQGFGPRALHGRAVVPSRGTHTERVLSYIQHAPAGRTRVELGRAFADIGSNSLSGAIQRLKDRGQIEALGRGRYRQR